MLRTCVAPGPISNIENVTHSTGSRDSLQSRKMAPTASADKVYCASALTSCYKQFKLWPMAVSWNPTKESFYLSKSYKIWFFTLFPILVGTGTSTCAFTLAHASHFKFTTVMFSGVLFPISLYVAGCGWVMFWYRDDIVLAYSRMRYLLEEQSRSDALNKHSNLNHEWRQIGQFLELTIKTLLPIASVVPFVLVLEKIDPYWSVLKYYGILESINKPFLKFLLITARYPMAIITILEGCRTYATCVICLFLWLEMQSKYLHNLKEVVKHIRMGMGNVTFIQWYQRFNICLKTWEVAASEWIRLLMSTLFAMIVVCLIVTVRYADQIPLSLLWFAPACAIMDVSIIYYLFPYMVGSNKDTKAMIHHRRRVHLNTTIRMGRWKQLLKLKSGYPLKVEKATLRGLMPISMKCRGMFVLRTQTKATFYENIISRTLDGILL